ncbi:MAG: hypothetical protein Q9213_000220 [Squamulea squamosa]
MADPTAKVKSTQMGRDRQGSLCRPVLSEPLHERSRWRESSFIDDVNNETDRLDDEQLRTCLERMRSTGAKFEEAAAQVEKDAELLRILREDFTKYECSWVERHCVIQGSGATAAAPIAHPVDDQTDEYGHSTKAEHTTKGGTKHGDSK